MFAEATADACPPFSPVLKAVFTGVCHRAMDVHHRAIEHRQGSADVFGIFFGIIFGIFFQKISKNSKKFQQNSKNDLTTQTLPLGLRMGGGGGGRGATSDGRAAVLDFPFFCLEGPRGPSPPTIPRFPVHVPPLVPLVPPPPPTWGKRWSKGIGIGQVAMSWPRGPSRLGLGGGGGEGVPWVG